MDKQEYLHLKSKLTRPAPQATPHIFSRPQSLFTRTIARVPHLSGKELSLVVTMLLIVFIPVSIFAVKQVLDLQSHAAPSAETLESESGIIGGSVTVREDQKASGGKYIQFEQQASTAAGLR